MIRADVRSNPARLILAVALLLSAVAPILRASDKGEGSDLEIGGPGAGNGKFNWLRDVAFDSKGVLYVLDGGTNDTPNRAFTGNMLVQKFDSNSGQFIGQFSIREEKLGDMDQPSRLTVDDKGNVYLSLPMLGLVQSFAPDGTLRGDVAVPHASAVAFQSVGDKQRVLIGTALRQDDKWTPVGELQTMNTDGKLGEPLKLSRPIGNIQFMRCDQQGNIYILGGINQVFRFDPQGTLQKIIGGGTELRLLDGSELYDSVAADSHGNIYSMSWGNPGALTRFTPDVSSMTMHQGQFHWADAWFMGSMVAIDPKDRVWIAVPANTSAGLTEGDAKYHYRPCIIRLESNFLDPTTTGVTTNSTRLIGLNLTTSCKLPYNVSTTLAPTSVDFVVSAGNRQISEVDVNWHAYDLRKNAVASGTFNMPLQDGVEARHAVEFTPPKYGWYEISFETSNKGQPLMGVASDIGFAPKYPNMVELPAGSSQGGWVDPIRQAFCGLPLIRIDSAQIKAPADADRICKEVETNHLTMIVQFQTKADCAPANVTQIVNLLKGKAKYYELINEPNFTIDAVSLVNTVLKPTRQLILSIDPDAKILGPDVCGIDLNWYEAFYKAGGKDYVDALSIHDYEGNESIDPGHWRWKMGELRKIMARYGDADKAIWQTERAIGAAEISNYSPGVQAVRVLLHRDLLESLGIPAEHNHLYYVNAGGYSPVPTYVWSASGPHPAALATRTRQAMIAGRHYDGMLDFGRTGNNLFMGLRYSGEDGTTITLRNYGQLDLPVDLAVQGGDAVEAVDAFGNVQSFPVEDGHVHLMTSTLPIYLRLAKGQEVTPPTIDFGANLALHAAFHYSAAVDGDMSMLNNGIFETDQPSNPHNKYWSGEMQVSPQYLEIEFPQPTKVDRMVVYTVRADNPYCALLDYDIQSFDGTKWNTLSQVRSACPGSDAVRTTDCAVTSWYRDQNLFVNKFSPVTTSRLRLVVLRATRGFMVDDVAVKESAFAGSTTQHLMLREIEIYAPQ